MTGAGPLFPRVLGETFGLLPAEVQATHQVDTRLQLTGAAEVIRGQGLWPRIIAFAFRFPRAARAVPVVVTKTAVNGGEVWERQFGTARFRSHLRADAHGLTERFGPFTFQIGLAASPDGLSFPVTAGRIGPFPLPPWALPRSVAKETTRAGRFEFDVALSAPLTGQLIVRYRGHLTLEE